ncbi:hypothetical protein RI103_35700 [Paraburkholderia sp. FT54]|jgi:hypothetical protein|uniref:hypothetical protein n=1 Tax=Paraburkholderia sp. FT54 TaxID=3074437 RepID=UPI0028773815|nr:hypothetical protein [Paraburkholderia sp. FT54]WNC94502.1 hypothetical protein RI103_35700 [Paraburkholderia sp. FT54]
MSAQQPLHAALAEVARGLGGSELACEQAVKTLLLLARGVDDEARSFALADDLSTDLKG